MEAETQHRDVLRIGDLISLKLPKNEGWLCADGILDQVYACKNPEYVEDVLWEVYVQNQYNCSKDYKETAAAAANVGNVRGKAAKLLEQLKQAELNEMTLNKKLMAMKIGKPVAFGDIVQLKHMKSKKMLTVLDTVLAKAERENMRIVLSKEGDSLSWLELIPRHKYDHEGQIITDSAELYIGVRERSGEYVHSAKKSVPNDPNREINSSLDNTTWVMYIYQHAPDPMAKDITAGQLISLQEIEMSSYITLDHCSPGITQEAYVVVSPMTQLSNVSADCNIGTGMLWMVEKKEFFQGGGIGGRGCKLSLRHFNSGLFMKFVDGIVRAVPDRAEATYFDFVLSQNSDGSSDLQEGCSVQLNFQGNWLSMQRAGVDRKCIPTRDKTQALSLILSNKTYRMFETEMYLSLECCRRLRVFEELVDDNSWQGVIPPEHMLKSVFSVLQTLTGFLTTEKGVISSNGGSDSSEKTHKIVPTETLAIRQTIIKEQGNLDALMDLLQSSENDCFADLGAATPAAGAPIRLQSKRFSGKMLGLTGVSPPVSMKSTSIVEEAPAPPMTRSPNQLSRKSGRTSLRLGGKMNQAAEDVCHEILDTLYYCLLHNHENKMYIADRFPVLLKQIKLQQAAVLCVKEILRNNLQLVQTKVREREMSIFLDLVINTEMNPTLLSLLQATCSCPMGVDSTQRMIVLALYNNVLPTTHSSLDAADDRDDFLVSQDRSLVIDISMDSMVVKQTEWVENVIYMPLASSSSAVSKEIMGYELVEKGLPRLHLSWEQDLRRNDFSVQNLFNYPKKVPLEIICNVIDSGQSISRRGSLTSFQSVKNGSAKKRRTSLGSAPKRKNSITRARRHGTLSVSTVDLGAAGMNQSMSMFRNSAEADADPRSPDPFKMSPGSPMKPDMDLSTRRLFTGMSNAKIYVLENDENTLERHQQGPKWSNIKTTLMSRGPRMGGKKGGKKRSNKFHRKGIDQITDAARGRPKSSHRVRRQSSFNQLNAVQRMKKKAGNQQSKSLEERRTQFVDYLVAQLYLAADLCLDRNYVAIGILGTRLPYSLLLTMLKSGYIPNQIKAPVCRILRCLHIDRDPQVPMRLPRLIRTSISLNGGDEADEVPSCQFALIQQIISDYINYDLDTTSCDALSTEMISLLESLMQFGFYATSAQLQDVINPLVQVLDDHRAVGVMMTAATKSEMGSSLAVTPKPLYSAPSGEAVDESGEFDQREVPLSSSIKRFQEMGLAKEHEPWFFSRWYQNVVDYMEDSYLYDRIAEYFTVGADDGPVGLFEVAPETMWEYKVLQMLESVRALYAILTLVIVASLLALLRVFNTVEEDWTYVLFDILVSAVFIAELALRMFCFFRVHRNITNFFRNAFNVNDFVVVVFDIVVIFLGASSGFKNIGTLAKVVRIVRIIRVFRIIRAAKLLSKIAEKAGIGSDWQFPARYLSVTEHEAKTIAGILRVLSLINLRIQDRQLGIVIKAFVKWYDIDVSGHQRNPAEVYEEVSNEKIENAEPDAFLPQKLDDVLLDIIMYSDPNLVEEALRLLMVHKSQKRLLLEATAKIQIISTPKVEAKYAELSQLLLKLNRAAEAFEVWGSLSTDEDVKEADNVSNCLSTIINLTRAKSNPQVLSPDPLYSAEPEVQQLLLNLDAVTTIIQFQFALCDGTLDIPHPDICNLLKKSNEIIKWFVANNEENQVAAFKNIEWFMRTLPLGVDSSLAVRAIVWGNKALAKECPRKYITDCLNNLANESKNPDYLDLLVGVTHISDVGDSGILSIRNEIALHLSHAENREQQWCTGPDSPCYEKRKRAMEPYLNQHPPPDDCELSPDLKYHINYIMLLSGCKLGPKLQAMYQVDDIVAAIIDPCTIYNVRFALGNLLLQSVTTGMSNLDASEGMWSFFESCSALYESDITELPLLFKRYDRVPLRAQKAAWYQVVNDIIFYFFSEFTFGNFNDATSFEQESGVRTTKLTESEAKLVIRRLSMAINEFTKKNMKIIGYQFSDSMKNVIEVLSFVLDVEMFETTTPQPHVARKNIPIRRNSVADEIQQVFYKKQFSLFIQGLAKSQTNVHREAVDMFERMPTIHDRVSSDIRLEPFITKVTSHIRSRVQRFTTTCVLDKSSYDSTMWILQTLRLVLEKNMGHDIYHITDPLVFGKADSPHVIKLQDTFNDCGVTDLCLDLISVGIDQPLCIQAVMLLVCLLSRSGGNLACQKKVYQYITKHDSTLFFEEVKELIEQQILWCQHDADSKDDTEMDNVSSADLPEQCVVLKMISLLCEGNFMPNKNVLREQDGNMRFVNILGCLVEYMKVVSRSETANCTNVGIRAVKCVSALLQGPCFGNQEYFVLHSDLLAALNRILRSSRPANLTEEWDDNIELFKEFVVDVLRACIEARPLSSTIIERVSSVIEANVLNVLIFNDVNSDRKDLSLLQANYLVFLQTLSPDDDDKPAYIKTKTAQYIASVEVVWNGTIHRHYFPVPDLASRISEESKNELLAEVEFSNQEGRLKDFLRRSRKLFREAVHYQGLSAYGLNNAWIVKEKLTWLMLANAIVMNVILIIYYDGTHVDREPQFLATTSEVDIDPEYTYFDPGYNVKLSSAVEGNDSIWIGDVPSEVLYWLNIVQIIAAGIVLSLVVLLRSPVIYQCAMELNGGRLGSIAKVLLDQLPLWYAVHFTLAVMALLYNHFILSALLFEFVAIDSATKDVLFTVINPARQLGVTVIIVIILTQVFSCVTFLYYRDQYLYLDCWSMWDSFKIGVTYGARAEEGIGKYMISSIDERMFMDMAFYFSISVILRNCFIGIIIDTFGTLRSKKMDRETDQNEICFICGLDKHEVDKRTSRSTESGFSHHRQVVHNIWNYLFFAIRIWNQHREEDSGVELHVRKCIMAGDISWLPIGVTGAVNDGESDVSLQSTSKHNRAEVVQNAHFDVEETEEAEGLPKGGPPDNMKKRDGRESRRESAAGIVAKKRLSVYPDSGGDKRNSSIYRKLSTIKVQLSKLEQNRTMNTPLLTPLASFGANADSNSVGGENRDPRYNTALSFNNDAEKTTLLSNLLELDSEFSDIQKRLSAISSKSFETLISPTSTSAGGIHQTDSGSPHFGNLEYKPSSFEALPKHSDVIPRNDRRSHLNPEDISPPTEPVECKPAAAEETFAVERWPSQQKHVDPAVPPPNQMAKHISAKVLRDMYYNQHSSSMISFSPTRSLKGPSLKQVEKIVSRHGSRKSTKQQDDI